jgi:hypothetical protein
MAEGTCAPAADTLAAQARKSPVVKARTRRWSARDLLNGMNRNGDRGAASAIGKRREPRGPTGSEKLRAVRGHDKQTY